MISQEEYLLDPCRVSSIPYWKMLQTAVPESMQILHGEDFCVEMLAQYTDAPYFRLKHDLRELAPAVLPAGYALRPATAEEMATHIRSCYGNGMTAAQVQAFTEKVEASFLVDKLTYLAKGGRCSAVAALGANLLNLKPCIDVKDGKMGVSKKYRGKYDKCLASYVKERLADRDDIRGDVLFVTQTSVSEDEYAAVMATVQEHGKFDTVYEAVAGCTVSCHCGPGTLGVLFMTES